MDPKIWFFVVPIVVFIVHQFTHRAAVAKNEKGKCAKCACELSENNFVGVTASHHTYGYCKSCGVGVKIRDRILMGTVVFLMLVALMLGAYSVYSG